MRIGKYLAVAALAAAPTLAFAAPAMTSSSYVMKAGAGDLFERQSSALVAKSTTNPKLKTFAQEMVTDHTKSTAAVKAAAMKAGLHPAAPKLTAKQTSDMSALRAATGTARDSLYIEQQKAAHQGSAGAAPGRIDRWHGSTAEGRRDQDRPRRPASHRYACGDVIEAAQSGSGRRYARQARTDAMKLFTIGYEATTMDAFLNALTSAGVQRVIDVRALPLSRRPGFSKTSLAASLATVGIDYVHLKSLGTPKVGRDAAKKGDVATLEAVYAGQLELPEAQAQAAIMLSLAEERPSALLCYERDPKHCHRTLLVHAVATGAEVVDLYC